MDITGKKLIVKAFQEEGVDTIFAYPGGYVTDIADELYRQGGFRYTLRPGTAPERFSFMCMGTFGLRRKRSRQPTNHWVQ